MGVQGFPGSRKRGSVSWERQEGQEKGCRCVLVLDKGVHGGPGAGDGCAGDPHSVGIGASDLDMGCKGVAVPEMGGWGVVRWSHFQGMEGTAGFLAQKWNFKWVWGPRNGGSGGFPCLGMGVQGNALPRNRRSRGSWCQKIEVQEGPRAQEWGFMEVLVPDKGVQEGPSPGEGDAGRSQYPGMGVQGGSRAQEGGCRVF